MTSASLEFKISPLLLITKQIFIDDFYLAQSGHENWCSNVFKILEKLNLEHLFYERKMVDIKEIKDQ